MIPQKGPGIFGSLIGMLIGLGLVIVLSPFLLWQSQSQDRAKEFQTAAVVSEDSTTEGYVIVEGNTDALDPFFCPQVGEVHEEPPASRDADMFIFDETDEDEFIFEDDPRFDEEEPVSEEGTMAADEPVDLGEPRECVAVTTVKEMYASEEIETCGEISEDQIVVRRTEDRCDDQGNCERCYIVKEFDWQETEREQSFARFTIGEYVILPDASAILVGTESFTDHVYEESKTRPVEGDERFRFTFLPLEITMLVAGNAESDGTIEGAFDGKPFVISQKGYEGTLDDLESRDKASSIMFIILSLIATVIGMVMIVGPVTYLTNILHIVPIVGKHVGRGFDGVVKFFAVMVGLVFWVLTFGLVIIAKNIIVVVVVLGVIGVILFILVDKGKIQLNQKGKKTIQE